MHRIDSATARPDANGIGKAGFATNLDLMGQDPTSITPEWCNEVQEEIATVVEDHQPLSKGSNGQLKAALYAIFSTKTETQEVDDRLSTAIVALGVAMQQAIIDERTAESNRIWPVGKGRHTTYDGLNPADASHLGFGTWILDGAAAGRVEVGAGEITIDYSSATGDAARDDVTRTFTHGDTGGELDHKQTLAELLNHNHADGEFDKLLRVNGQQTSDATDNGNEPNLGSYGALQAVGGSQPFNVLQPYRVVSVWVRTA